VKDKWMRLATGDKRDNPISLKYGRLRTGSKGIGRFAARRLSYRLLLDSVARDRIDNQKKRILVEFNWPRNFPDGMTLTEIKVDYTWELVSDETPTGVKLHLEDVIDMWKEEDIAYLRKELVTQINPHQDIARLTKAQIDKQDPGFDLMIRTNEYKDYEGELSEKFLQAAWATLEGKKNSEGKVGYSLKVRETGQNLELNPLKEDFEKISDVEFKIDFFVYAPEHFQDLDFGVRDASRIGREQGGVRIYLDGFRVFPYGDTTNGDDWLELDRARASRTSYLLSTVEPTISEMQESALHLGDRPELTSPGNNQLIGYVEISSTRNKSLEILASREGFVENEAFRQLKRFVQIGILWMNLQYAKVTYEKRQLRRDERRKKDKASPSEILSEAKVKIQQIPNIPQGTKEELTKQIDVATQEFIEQEQDRIDEINLLRVLSATGTTISMMNHQLRSMQNNLEGVHSDLNEVKEYVNTDARDKFDQALNLLDLWRKSIKSQVSQLGFLVATNSSENRDELPIHTSVKDVTEPLSFYISDYGIDLTFEIPLNIKTPPMFSSQFHAILLHVLTNALKAVRQKQNAKVCIKAIKDNSAIHIYIMDNGVGIPQDKREWVFGIYNSTTSAPDPVWGNGTGLGLKIVRDILMEYNGTATFIDAESPWETCLEIYIPRG
jgi:signal transduction histidine kinase